MKQTARFINGQLLFALSCLAPILITVGQVFSSSRTIRISEVKNYSTYEKEDINKHIKENLKRFDWVHVLRISALTSKGIKLINNVLTDINQQLRRRVPTSDLNIYLRELWRLSRLKSILSTSI